MSQKDNADLTWERDALARILKLVDPKNLRAMLLDARKRGSNVVEQAAYEKLCAVRISEKTNAEPGTVEHDVWRSFVETEELLSEKRGRTVRLSRTRQMILRHGATSTVIKIVLRKDSSTGFGDLMDLERPDPLFEAIALRHSDGFDAETRAVCAKRLEGSRNRS